MLLTMVRSPSHRVAFPWDKNSHQAHLDRPPFGHPRFVYSHHGATSFQASRLLLGSGPPAGVCPLQSKQQQYHPPTVTVPQPRQWRPPPHPRYRRLHHRRSRLLGPQQLPRHPPHPPHQRRQPRHLRRHPSLRQHGQRQPRRLFRRRHLHHRGPFRTRSRPVPTQRDPPHGRDERHE